MSRVNDPVTLQIMWSRLIQIADEMWWTIWRTSFSTIIGEALDFGCELLDGKGGTLAHSPRSMPVFNLTLPVAVKYMMEHFPEGSLDPGDVLIHNDPWQCAGHLNDLAIVTPVFRNGKVVALCGAIGHVSDIGGTTDRLNARELYEEGIQIPPMKLVKAGVLNQELLGIIALNVRKSEMVIGDIHALITANNLAAQRLTAFMDEYGLEDLTEVADAIQGRAEQAMREAIAALPDGDYHYEVTTDGRDHPLTIPVTVRIRGDELELDFTGAPPQVDKGGINCTYSYAAAHSTYALKCILTPEVPSNAGDFRPIRVTAPPGSILNCDKPAAVADRTKTGWHLGPTVFGALAQALRSKVRAFTALPCSVMAYGLDRHGRRYHDHMMHGGGQGAGEGSDGRGAILFPTSAGGVSIEVYETRVPVVVEAKAFVPDTGGPGQWRGGPSQEVRFHKLHDDGRPMHISIRPEGVYAREEGFFGGGAGAPVRLTLREGGVERDLGRGGLFSVTRTDQEVCLRLGGGSGFGDPRRRDPEKVLKDIADGYVTTEGAERDYGLSAATRRPVQQT